MKHMEQQELLQDAIGMIGEDLIDDADRRPRRPIIIRWSAVACACLAVVIGLSAIFGSSSEPWIPTGKPWQPVIAEGVEEVRLEADVLQNLFSYTYYGETNAYVKKYAPHIGALAVSPIPQAEYLPIYQAQYEQGDPEELEAFIQKYLAAANELYGYDVWDYEIEEGLYGSSHYEARLAQRDGSHLTFLSYGDSLRFYNWPESYEKGFQFKGEPVSLLDSDTDRQIEEKLSELIAHINRTLGKNYSDISIKKFYNDSELSKVNVCLYNAENTEPPTIFDASPIGSDYMYGIIAGAKNADAAGYFLRHFLDYRNYDLQNTFITAEAGNFYYEVTNTVAYEKYFNFDDACCTFVGASGSYIFNNPAVKAAPAQVNGEIQSVSNVVDQAVKAGNELIAKVRSQYK